MSDLKFQAPLSNLQLELLKLYGNGISDEYLDDLKLLIAKFLFAKARMKADKIWDEKEYTDQIVRDLINKDNE
ncbi:MAG: hypothetical protein R2828_19870 [Saprospiraceae bacterium]